MNAGWWTYIFTLLLGTSSYIVCIISIRNKKRISLRNFLFDGNNAIMGAFSIVGSSFSVTLFFTALVASYVLYGIWIQPVAIISVLSGLILLKKKLKRIDESLFSHKYGELSNVDRAILRFKHFSQSMNSPNSFFFYLLFYISLMIITEFSAFNYIVNTFLQNDPWAPFVIYIAIATALAYVFISGFRGVLVTDTLQTVIIFIIFIIIFLSIPKANISSISVFTVFTKVGDIAGLSIAVLGGSFFAIAMSSAAPEIWLRAITLKKCSEGQKAISISMILFPIIGSIPFIIPVLLGIMPTFQGSSTASFDVWQAVSGSSSTFLPILCMALLTTAFFTTVDTFIITYSQVLFLVKNNFLEKFLPKNVRNSSIGFILFCLFIANNLSIRFYSLLGVYAGSLPIYLFSVLYIYPYLKQKKIISSFYNISFWLQICVGFPLIWITNAILPNTTSIQPIYPLIPIYVAALEVIGLIINIILNKRRGKKYGKAKTIFL